MLAGAGVVIRILYRQRIADEVARNAQFKVLVDEATAATIRVARVLERQASMLERTERRTIRRRRRRP